MLSVEALTKNLPVSEYKKVKIFLDSDYKWGRGWSVSDKNRFENDVYDRFLQKGYAIEGPTMSGTCSTLKKKGSNLNLYMHPMEFSGYATEEEIEDIVATLNEADVCSVIGATDDICYKITDNQYRDILSKNMKDILEFLRVEYQKGNRFNAEFEFAERYRVPRIDDPCGYSSDDVDCRFIRNACYVLEGLGLLK